MGYFCGQCGSKLDEKTGLCPQCQYALFVHEQKSRKTVKAIVAVLCCVAVLAVGTVLLSYFDLIDLPILSSWFAEEEETEILGENELKALAQEEGIVSAWEYADYDDNGTNEAFAVITDEELFILKTVFVSSDGQITIVEEGLSRTLYISEEGNIRTTQGKRFFWADMGASGSAWQTLLYSVKDNKPYVLQLSGTIQGFYEKDDIFYTTENDILSEGGHTYANVELLYDATVQEFSKGQPMTTTTKKTTTTTATTTTTKATTVKQLSEEELSEYITVLEDMLKSSYFAWDKEGIMEFSAMSNEEIIREYIAFKSVSIGMYEYFSGESLSYLPEIANINESGAQDPKKRFALCYELDADLVDWILINVFQKTPDRTTDFEKMYYQGDKVYVSTELGGGPGYTPTIQTYEQLADGSYKLTVLHQCRVEEYSYSFSVIAVPREDKKHGKYWTILSYEKASGSEATQTTATTTTTTVTTTTTRVVLSANGNIWETIPSEYVFTSGVGGWGNEMMINSDGTFVGQYHDSDMGVTGEGYPNGTVYICKFSGKFTTPQKVSDTIYSMKLESLEIARPEGEEYIEKGTKYICSNPYGLDDADEFYIYLPGTPLSDVEEMFLSWAHLNTNGMQELPEGFYGVYNIGGQQGFVSYER